MDIYNDKILQIAACDDEPIILRVLVCAIEQAITQLGKRCQIQAYLSGQELLENIECVDIVFLDINMPVLDGIQTGNLIMRKNPKCKIIIASGWTERFQETYKINTFRFVKKPYDEEEIKEAIQAYYNQLIGLQTIELYRNRKQYIFPQKDISYVMSYGSYVEVMIKDKMYRKVTSLNEMEEILDDRCFIRIHRQYIVNMYWVTDFKGNKVYILEREIPLARRRYSIFQKRFMEFDVHYK